MSYVMTGKAEGSKGRPTSLSITVDEAAHATFSPKFNIRNFKNVQLNYQGTPSKMPPTLKRCLDQVHALAEHDVRSLPNLRFSIDVPTNPVVNIYKLNCMLGFVDFTCTATHTPEEDYPNRMMFEGLIGNVPFTCCFLWKPKLVLGQASYYPSHQMDVQMDLDPMAYFDPRCKRKAYVVTPKWSVSKFVPSKTNA